MPRKITKKPRFRQSLFWDVNPKTIDPKKHARYIIERVLDFGNDKEIAWLTHQYSSRRIKNTLQRSRVVHRKSRSLWSLIFR